MAIEDYLDFLPTVLAKSKNSNIAKIFKIFDTHFSQLKETLRKTEEWQSINHAKGKTLDLLGDNVNQHRGQLNDDLYRIFVRGRIARNMADGSINKIIQALSVSLNCPPSAINIENYVLDDEGKREPAAIRIVSLPRDALSGLQLTPEQFMQLTGEVVAAGVSVHYAPRHLINKNVYAISVVSSDIKHVRIHSNKRSDL